ncbi:MAG: hypothetical protein ACNA8L_05740 [Luteolibacter sp.]|jgi:hypothetical protein
MKSAPMEKAAVTRPACAPWLHRTLRGALILPIALLVCHASRAHARLPSLDQSPWIGYFAGSKATRGMFGITVDGTLYYNHSADLENVNSGYFHRIHPSVEETRPDGEIVRHRLDPDSLKTADQPTTSPTMITYQGKVRGGAVIEVVVDFSRRDVSIGGRIVQPAAGNTPQRFILHVEAPPFYLSYGEDRIRREGSAAEKAELERRNAPQRAIAAKETLVLRRLNGTRVRQPILDSVDLTSPDFNGDGFNTIDIDLNALRGRKVAITTTENARMKLSNEKPQPIFKHRYDVIWMEDPATKNPGRGRLVFTTR